MKETKQYITMPFLIILHAFNGRKTFRNRGICPDYRVLESGNLGIKYFPAKTAVYQSHLSDFDSAFVINLNNLASGDCTVMLACIRMIAPGTGRFHPVLDRSWRGFTSVDQCHTVSNRSDCTVFHRVHFIRTDCRNGIIRIQSSRNHQSEC